MGRGIPVETAFVASFGLSLGEAESEFVRFARETEGRPAERFRGTVYERYVPASRR